MAKRPAQARTHFGRPKGPKRSGMYVRLLPQQKRDLRVLKEIMEGHPPVNGLVEEAVRQYIVQKLENPQIRAEFDRRTKRSFRVFSSPRSRALDAG